MRSSVTAHIQSLICPLTAVFMPKFFYAEDLIFVLLYVITRSSSETRAGCRNLVKRQMNEQTQQHTTAS